MLKRNLNVLFSLILLGILVFTVTSCSGKIKCNDDFEFFGEIENIKSEITPEMGEVLDNAIVIIINDIFDRAMEGQETYYIYEYFNGCDYVDIIIKADKIKRGLM